MNIGKIYQTVCCGTHDMRIVRNCIFSRIKLAGERLKMSRESTNELNRFPEGTLTDR